VAVTLKVERRRAGAGSGAEPLAPRKKWLAITLATLVLVPAYWSLLAALVARAPNEAAGGGTAGSGGGGPDPAAALALGLALVPFVFIVLAFGSGHPRAPGAVVRAMVTALLVGIPVSVLAGDAVTGIVAGVGGGAVLALRADDGHSLRRRAWAVVFASLYTFVLVRTAGPVALLPAPVLPLTAIGIADHVSEWRRDRELRAS
jgi:hypothetical protein